MNLKHTLYLIGFIFIYHFKCVYGNSDCNLITKSDHQISGKDFKVTRYHAKYVMCAAYYCSSNPSLKPLQLIINEINSTKDDVEIYLDKRSETITRKNRVCNNELSRLSADENEEHHKSCLKLEPSKSVEIHVRFEKPENYNTESEECVWDMNFNISIHEFSCQEGVTTNIPASQDCNGSLVLPSNSEVSCIKPNCSESVITETDSFIHKFVPNNYSYACIWNIQANPTKTIEISFTSAIKNYLIVYEGNLLNPKWNLKQCSAVTSHLKIKSLTGNIFILYKNNESIGEESFLEVNITSEECSLSKTIENGNVKFQPSENGTVAIYTCYENYSLMGKNHINCNDKKTAPPLCLSEKAKYMADDPQLSNESTQPSNIKGLESNLTMSFNLTQEFPSVRSSYKTMLTQNVSTPKDKLASDEPEVSRSNISLIELDQGISDTTKVPSNDDIPTTASPTEGSGQHSHSEDDDGFSDMSDADSGTHELDSSAGTNVTEVFSQPPNSSKNNSYLPPWHSEGGILFTLPSLEDNMMLLIIIGVGVLFVLIIIIISVIVCRNRSIRSGLNRKFDTFQNPIYEKPVVRVPIPTSDSDPSHEKLDLGDLSDSTVLD